MLLGDGASCLVLCVVPQMVERCPLLCDRAADVRDASSKIAAQGPSFYYSKLRICSKVGQVSAVSSPKPECGHNHSDTRGRRKSCRALFRPFESILSQEAIEGRVHTMKL
jgi:hypothetical protein